MRLKPIGKKVVLKPKDEETVTPGGIYLPDKAREKAFEGVVMAVGDITSVTIGDTVIHSRYGGTEVVEDGETYLILAEDQLIAIRG